MSYKREAVNPPGSIQINKILILSIFKTYYVTIVESRALKQEMCQRPRPNNHFADGLQKTNIYNNLK